MSEDVGFQGLTLRELVLDLHRDMKVVRPAVERLLEANLPTRVDAIETQRKVEAAAIEAAKGTVSLSALVQGIGAGRSIVLFGLAVMGALVAISDILSKLHQ